MASTTGEHASWYVLDAQLHPVEAEIPAEVRRIVDRIGESCWPSLALRAVPRRCRRQRAPPGVTENPVLLTPLHQERAGQCDLWRCPGLCVAGRRYTVMADVLRMPDNSFGTVPTPAIVAPIRVQHAPPDYEALGGHTEQIRSLREVLERGAWHNDGAPQARVWQTLPAANP